MNIISAPSDLVIANSDGIDVRFAGINLDRAPGYVGERAGEQSVHLHLNGIRGTETQLRDSQFLRDLQDWSERDKDLEVVGQEQYPPQMPSIAVFDQIGIELTDDVGTEYRRVGGKMAGSGTEWDVLWIYTPAPPPNARTLQIGFDVDGQTTGKHCILSLD
ncbi:hypothetical protein ACIQTZ_18030 [Paenarthrobacter sp. NPDC090520]|uniref:hypothetical protein n=1 Tax=Paenarthrobacter sp. NPDC090520 TaxID=3364382 RepID=UPI00381C493B